ncbi:MAG: tetratricopeptide repeat protein [Dehalococcoidia bacterium]
MRAATLRPATMSGVALLGAGAALLALVLAIILLADGGGSHSPAAVSADPYAVTNSNVAFWEARVQRDPADFVAYNRLAGAYLQRARETGDVGDYSRAQAAVDTSLAELPGDNPSAYALLASLQNVRHEFAAAIETAHTAQRLDPSDAFAHAIIGDAQIALGLYDEAFDSYNQLVSQAPGLSAFSRLAHIYELCGDLANAEGAWENALSTDGGRNAEATAWARVNFGTFKFSQGSLDDAADQYDAALEAFPGYIHALAGQARVAAARGDYDRGIDLYTQVTDRQPLPEYIAALGDVYAVAGQPSDAQRQYDLIGVIDQLYKANGINTDLQMAIFFADHDISLSDAIQQSLAVYDAQPDSIYAADAVAWSLYKADRAAEALRYVDQALRLGTVDASVEYHAGMIYGALGDEQGARDHLARALEINPHFSVLQAPIAQQALEDLEA